MPGKHPWAAVALALGLALLPSSLLGTTVLRLGTQDLFEQSPAVILGEVLEQESRLYEDGGFPFTLTTIAVEESFKGDPRPVIRIFTLGGQVDDLIGEVPGAARFTPGERVFLFLSPKEGWENTYACYGMFQGKWTVVTDADGESYLENGEPQSILAEPADEIVPLDELCRLPYDDFLQALRSLAGRN